MGETAKKKASALRTMLEMMDVPEMRLDTTRPANVRWLQRNLRINNADHPMFETAWTLIGWLIQNAQKEATTSRNNPVC